MTTGDSIVDEQAESHAKWLFQLALDGTNYLDVRDYLSEANDAVLTAFQTLSNRSPDHRLARILISQELHSSRRQQKVEAGS